MVVKDFTRLLGAAPGRGLNTVLDFLRIFFYQALHCRSWLQVIFIYILGACHVYVGYSQASRGRL